MITLISDIDGTLLGDPQGLKDFNLFVASIRDKICIIYASGRNYQECLNAIKNDGLLVPDALISSTGADIHIKNGNNMAGDNDWHNHINTGGWNVDAVRKILEGLQGLHPQIFYSPFKASYNMNPADQLILENEVKRILKLKSIKAKVIASHGVYLDILPEKCDKGEAALYLTARLNIKNDNVLVAGDSENDIDLFMKFKHGIIVGNAFDSMKKALKNGNYYQSEYSHAAGLLDGLKHYLNKKMF
jgi:sucrose-phosphate synthase